MILLSQFLNILLILWIISAFILGHDFYELFAESSLNAMYSYLALHGIIFAASFIYCALYRKLPLYRFGFATFLLSALTIYPAIYFLLTRKSYDLSPMSMVCISVFGIMGLLNYASVKKCLQSGLGK